MACQFCTTSSGSRAGLAENSRTAHCTTFALQRSFDSGAAAVFGGATTERMRSGPAQKKEKEHCLHFHRNNMGKQNLRRKNHGD